MSEKTDALVIRLADFSESSKVVTLFTLEFGKLAALAKGAKRLKGPFEAALDLLSQCRVVCLRKSSGGLDLLTEAQLVRRFQPQGRDMFRLYGGYYIAELLDGLTEINDPHPQLFHYAVQVLARLSTEPEPRIPLLQFELALLQEIGHLPDFDTCQLCGSPVVAGTATRFWVSQGGLICDDCGRPEYQNSQIHPGTIAVLHRLLTDDPSAVQHLSITKSQFQELRRLLTAAICYVMERRPKMLGYLNF